MISIVIRTRNEVSNLKKLLPILKAQNLDSEIIIVDSDSGDGTEQFCKEHGCIFVQCPEPFSFGKALNIGIKKCSSDFICILSSHCFPTDNMFLYNMFTDFKYNDVAGVYARQVPHQLTNPLEYRNFLHIYGNERITQHKSPLFNNGASMIRKCVWNDIRFDEKVFAQEDVLWAKHVIDKGYIIIYEPCSIVEHLHNEDLLHTVHRYEKESRALQEMEFAKW